MEVTPLNRRANVVYCLKGSCDKTQSYIDKTKGHLTVRVHEHLSGKSGKSVSHEHISSFKNCHACSISNTYILAQANTDFEAKIKVALHRKNLATKYIVMVLYFLYVV